MNKTTRHLEQDRDLSNKNGKTLVEYRGDYERNSSKLSDLNRYVAFAGIGLIWVFTKTDTGITIPRALILPAIFLVSALVLDMLQYLYSTIVWYHHFRKNEKKHQPEETKYTHSIYWTYPPWVLWGAKIGCVFIAYGIIFVFLVCTLIA